MLKYAFFFGLGSCVFFVLAVLCGLVVAATMTFVGYPTSISSGALYWIALIGIDNLIRRLHVETSKIVNG